MQSETLTNAEACCVFNAIMETHSSKNDPLDKKAAPVAVSNFERVVVKTQNNLEDSLKLTGKGTVLHLLKDPSVFACDDAAVSVSFAERGLNRGRTCKKMLLKAYETNFTYVQYMQGAVLKS